MLPDFNDSSGRTVDSPINVSGEAKPAPRPAPGVGEHSVEILTEFGIGEGSISNLQKTGVIQG